MDNQVGKIKFGPPTVRFKPTVISCDTIVLPDGSIQTATTKEQVATKPKGKKGLFRQT